MADIPVTGASSYVVYGEEETAYGTESAAIAGNTGIAFGNGLSITSRLVNNIIKVRGLGDRNIVKQVAGRFDGILDIEFILGTSHWMGALLGAAASTSSAPYIHTYTEADTLDSMTIENGVDLGTTDSVRRFLGCKINSATLSCRVGEPVMVRLNILYKTETEGTSLDATPAVDAEEPMIFTHGSVALPGGTLARVQSIDLTIVNSLRQVLGLGSRFAQKSIPLNREYNFSLVKTFEVASDMLEGAYGGATAPVAAPAEIATLVLAMTNGLADADERHIYFTGTGLQYNDDSIAQRVGEIINENVSGSCNSGEIIGEDDTATTIFD